MPTLNVSLLPLTTTGLAATMTVNGLVSGLIVFKILKVFLEVRASSTSVERTLGSTGGTKFQHIIFVIIESGMTLLVIQLVRTVLFVNLVPPQFETPVPVFGALDYLIVVNEMFNVIIRSIHFPLLLLY